MAKKYSLIYKSPEVECSAEADTFSALESTFSARLARLLTLEKCFEGMSLDEAAQKALEICQGSIAKSRQHRVRTKIKAEGASLDVIKYYLQNLTFSEISESLQRDRGIKISRSVIWRFCQVLIKDRIYPQAKFSKKVVSQNV